MCTQYFLFIELNISETVLKSRFACSTIVLFLEAINYVLHIINLSQILIMTLPCCYKGLVSMLVAILLLIECTNLAKADNQADSYQYYPDYQYPDQNSKYDFFILMLAQIDIKSGRPLVLAAAPTVGANRGLIRGS